MSDAFNLILPPNSLRRTFASKLLHSIQGHQRLNPFYSLTNFFDKSNIKNFRTFSGKGFACNICGRESKLCYDFPNIAHRHLHSIGVLRETLQCGRCGATMRDRTVAHALLGLFNGRNTAHRCNSIAELATADLQDDEILDTDSFGPISKLMHRRVGFKRSSYIPSVGFGEQIEKNRFNINLESISFPDDSFDVLITSDVAEHIRDIDRAHSEIYRVLRKNGSYVFTVPYDGSRYNHLNLVDTTSEVDIHLVPPQFHGDPLTGGILAYRVFGRAIISDLQKIGFHVEFKEVVDPMSGIFGGDVFVATK